MVDNSVFKLDKLANQPYEKDEIVQMDVTIEMNLDLGVIQRTGYNVLDVLSDIGGIQSIIITTFSVLIGFWNYKHFDSYMASKLYKLNSRSAKTSQKTKFIVPNRFCNIGHYLMDHLVTEKCRQRCCKKSRK